MRKVLFLCSICTLLPLSLGEAGVYYGTNILDANFPVYAVFHPYGYDGMTPGPLAIEICAASSATPLTSSIEAAINFWNARTVGVGNCAGTCGLYGQPDGEGPYIVVSTLVHELGHCALALDHVNFEKISGELTNHTATAPNDQNQVSITAGADGVPGTSDDVVLPLPGARLIHWYQVGHNNPYHFDATPIDRNSYTRRIDLLPASHRWATSGNAGVGAHMQYPPKSHSPMFSLGTRGTSFNAFIPDDINTVKFAETGADELLGTGDEYSVQLVFTADCANADVQVKFEPMASGLADCLTWREALPNPTPGHFRLRPSPPSLPTITVNKFRAWDVSLLLWARFEGGNTAEWSFTQP